MKGEKKFLDFICVRVCAMSYNNKTCKKILIYLRGLCANFHSKNCSNGIRANNRSTNVCITFVNLVLRDGFISFRSSWELLLMNRFKADSRNAENIKVHKTYTRNKKKILFR